jgi:hypothetical protein
LIVMMPTRRIRKLAACIGIATLLFAQVAVAAHACSAPANADAVVMQMPCADLGAAGSGAQDKNVCFHHCYAGPLSLDLHPAQIPPSAPVAYHAVPEQPSAVSAGLLRNHSRVLLARVTAPPLSVRNCCFRI